MTDAEIHELKEEMKRLQNSVHRLASMVKTDEVREEKEVTKERGEKKDRKERDEDEERRRERGEGKAKKK